MKKYMRSDFEAKFSLLPVLKRMIERRERERKLEGEIYRERER